MGSTQLTGRRPDVSARDRPDGATSASEVPVCPRQAGSRRAQLRGLHRARPVAARLSVPALIVAGQALATVLAVLEVKRGLGIRNLEASYHAILTAEALLRTPVGQHWGLPLVSLGAANDKWIPWGATVATAQGDYVYTSFPPAGFWLPAAAAALRGGDLGLSGLVVVNGLLGAASAVLLYLLVVHAVRRMGRGVWLARGAGLAGAVLYLSSAEALQSHGAVYWSQSLLQPLLLGQLLVLGRLLEEPGARARQRLLLALGALTVIACYTEWTAYVFAGFTGVALLAVPALRRRAAAAGLVLAGAAAVTAGVLAAHFVLVIGVDGAVEAWSTRFLARSGEDTPLLYLFSGYALSFGGGIAAALVILAMAVARPAAAGRPDLVSGAVLAFSSTPLVENLLLLQHATQFTFDRLKFGIPLALAVGLAIGLLGRRGVAVAGLVVCAAAMVGISAHRTDAVVHERWPAVDQANRSLLAAVRSEIDLGCATIGTNTKVRGYTNVVVDRGVHEGQSLPELTATAAQERACGTVFIEGELVFADLPRFVRATVVHRDGSRATLHARPA